MLLNIFDLENLKARNATQGSQVIELEAWARSRRAFWLNVDSKCQYVNKPNFNFDLKEDDTGINGNGNGNSNGGLPNNSSTNSF